MKRDRLLTFVVVIFLFFAVVASVRLFKKSSSGSPAKEDVALQDRKDPSDIMAAPYFQRPNEKQKKDRIESPRLPYAYEFATENKQYWMAPLIGGTWRTVDHTDYMRAEDPIVGLYFQNKAWALPWWILKNHHVADLDLEGRKILVTFCELCSSSVGFNRVLNGRTLTFRLRGQYNGSIMISDDETDTLWAPFSGKALAGNLKGSQLEPVPLFQSTWSEWISLHPNSFAAYEDASAREKHGSNSRPGQPGISRGFKATLLRPIDTRLPDNTLVLGVVKNGKARAYPISTLDSVGLVLNDVLGEEPIVVMHQPGTNLASAYSRKLGKEILSFEQTKDGKVTDQQHGYSWNTAGEGRNESGSDKQLSFVFSDLHEWYLWAAYYPETDIFVSKK